jgi:LAO/AO transport system kinase
MEEKVKEELMKKAREGRVDCREARKIAEDLGVTYAQVGGAANELRIKITNCELGCF